MRIALVVVMVLGLAETASAVKTLPEKAKLDAAKLVARDRYFNELKKGETEQLKTFLDAADATTDDDARQAALYLVVADAAVENGKLTLALEALDRLGEQFDYDVPAGKMKLLEAAVKGAKSADARSALVNRLLEVMEQAAEVRRFDVAEQAARLAESIAVKLRDTKLRKDLAAKRAKIEARRKEDTVAVAAFARAQAVLKGDPNDREANGIVGLHLVLSDEWTEALVHLTKADDEELCAAAAADIARPQEPIKQLELADAWWQVADNLESEKQRAALRARAAYWYSRAAAELEGPRRARAKRRSKLPSEEPAVAGAAQAAGDDNLAELTLANGVSLRLVRIPASSDEKIKSFWLGETEFTESQWAATMGGIATSPHLPKILISFNDCRLLLTKLNSMPAGRRYRFRLPTPQEFAHACGKPSSFAGSLADYAWFRDASPEKLQPVGQKKRNAFGLFDILGNAWEFADDVKFYGLSAWDTDKDPLAAFASVDLPANYQGTRADYSGNNVGVRIAADLR